MRNKSATKHSPADGHSSGLRQLRRLRGESKPARGKLGPEAVYTVLRHALTAKKPRPHYVVTTPAKQGVLLKKLLPAALFYRIVGRLG